MGITRINEFQSAPNKEEELYVFLKSLIPYIASSEGSISCEVLRHNENTNTFLVIEKWQSIESHKKSVGEFPKEQMQAAMSLFGCPPKGGYYA
jgi:quinol monooxygenase YgiN